MLLYRKMTFLDLQLMVILILRLYVFLEVLLMYGLVSRAVHVRQLLLHFLISGDAFGASRGSQRRLRSQSILVLLG